MNDDLSPFKNPKVATAQSIPNKRGVRIHRWRSGHFCLEFFWETNFIGAFNIKKMEHMLGMVEVYYSGTCDTFELLSQHHKKHAMLKP